MRDPARAKARTEAGKTRAIRAVFKAWAASSVPFALLAACALADQWSKNWAAAHLRMFQRLPIFGQSILVVSRSANRGLAFDRYSWLPDRLISPYVRYLPTLVLASLAALAWTRWKQARSAERIGYCLAIAGGASNLVDHWRYPYVVDVLQLYLGRSGYLPFNLADTALVLGTILVALTCLAQLRRAY